MDILSLAVIFSGISFLFFGVTCLTTRYMKSEFTRYGYDRQRPLTGVLQILGGAGVLLGYYFSPLLAMFATIGLTLMMMVGVGVRIKIGDTLIQTIPAFTYVVVNAYIAYRFAQML